MESRTYPERMTLEDSEDSRWMVSRRFMPRDYKNPLMGAAEFAHEIDGQAYTEISLDGNGDRAYARGFVLHGRTGTYLVVRKNDRHPMEE